MEIWIADWKLRQIKRAVKKARDPYLGETLEDIEKIADLSDAEVERLVLEGKNFELFEPPRYQWKLGGNF